MRPMIEDVTDWNATGEGWFRRPFIQEIEKDKKHDNPEDE
jgi:hypothetical protein